MADVLTEAETAARLRVTLHALRLARFRGTGPDFFVKNGRAFYPLAPLEYFEREAKRRAAAVAAAPAPPAQPALFA
jgi:hypothetical protein